MAAPLRQQLLEYHHTEAYHWWKKLLQLLLKTFGKGKLKTDFFVLPNF